jgi:plasmid stabilization system protein ParE
VPRRRRASIRLLRPAEEDLTEISEYIAADNPGAAERLLLRIEKDLNALARRPMLGPVPRDPDIAQLEYRYLVLFQVNG